MPPITQLPPNQTRFQIDITGTRSGEHYRGEFIYKRLTIGESLKAKCMKTRLLEGQDAVDLDAEYAATAIAWLHFGLLEQPKWWDDPLNLEDLNIITEVYNKVLEFEMQFQNKIEKIGEEAPPVETPELGDDKESEDGKPEGK